MSLTPVGKLAVLILVVAVAGGSYYEFRQHMAAKPAQQDWSQSQPEITQQQAPATTPVPVQPPAPTSAYVAQQDTLKSILTNRVVRVSVENPSDPFYSSEGGLPHGFNVDFDKLLFGQSEFGAATIRVDTKHEVTTYAAVPQQLLINDGDGHPVVDIAMDGLTFQDNTPPGVVYTDPYVTDFGYALIVKSGSPIRSAADLSGKTIGILQGDPDVKAFVTRMYPNSTIKTVSDSDPHFIDKSVDDQVVDAFVYDYPFAVDSIKDTDLKFAVSKLDGSDISYKIGVRSSSQSLLFALNSAIAKVKQSPAYLDLLRKYFISNQVVTVAAVSGEHTYVVRAGDTLNLIASSQMGSGSKYGLIQKRNNLPNPNLILIGQKLVIPARS
jgi:ABC-type amino acid transport substrate-binding protein